MSAALADAQPMRTNAPPADHRALRFLTARSVDDGKSTLVGVGATALAAKPLPVERHRPEVASLAP